MTAMVCPVSIGAFGTGDSDRVDPTALNPENVYHPMIFSLWHFLSEGQDEHALALRRDNARLSAAAEVVSERRGQLFGSWRHSTVISQNEQEMAALRERIAELKQTMSEEGRRAVTLMSALAGMPIIKDGEWQS
ncbi:hypothetical protein ACFQ1L_46320 [Phytohabitans flavus]|uniref:hypothetical protein n=1 Tax=Phytohabitans flavus TaxID=1076124 RepID=UPI00362FA65A